MIKLRLLKCLFLVDFWCTIHISLAQKNLVPNSGFEEYVKCPVTFSTDPLHFGPNNWNSATQGTPDYFNRCSIGDMHVPNNWAGVSQAHSGFGYAGIYAWNTGKKNYREYVQCKLTKPLKKGAFYKIQFFYRLSSYSVYAIDRIGLALSTEEAKANYDTLLNFKPIITEVKDLQTLTNAWMSASAKIQATGGEQFLIIGNFSSNDSTESMKIDYREGKSLMLGHNAYYYIDDVVVLQDEIEVSDEEPFVQAPKLNETYILKNIQFQSNSYDLLPSSFVELDILISIMKKNLKWKVQLSGHTDDQGTDEYNLILSRNRAQSVGDYLIQKGVATERIQTLGFGKQKPIHESKDETARAINRRVEAKFID
jgi:outer membrane protein OmpA-like peptidoglycan-associated protein